MLLAVAALAEQPPASASPVPEVQPAKQTCPHSDGYLQGPFIPNDAAARRVFLAYRASIEPHHSRDHRTKVIVEDEGQHWSVYESIPVRATNIKVIVVMGGGGLGMTLDKCSGAVLSASFQR